MRNCESASAHIDAQAHGMGEAKEQSDGIPWPVVLVWVKADGTKASAFWLTPAPYFRWY